MTNEQALLEDCLKAFLAIKADLDAADSEIKANHIQLREGPIGRMVPKSRALAFKMAVVLGWVPDVTGSAQEEEGGSEDAYGA